MNVSDLASINIEQFDGKRKMSPLMRETSSRNISSLLFLPLLPLLVGTLSQTRSFSTCDPSQRFLLKILECM